MRNAYAVAYAGFRLAQNLRIAGLKEAVESKSLNILLAALDGHPAIQTEAITDLETIIGFGRDTGHIHHLTAELLFAELAKLKANPAKENPAEKIAGLPNPANEPAMLSREELFPHREKPAARPIINHPLTLGDAVPRDFVDRGAGKIQNEELLAHADEKEDASVSQEAYLIRKSAILEKIRQSGNCRIKDLQDVAGSISERTLRYVLSRMLQEGIIERIGNSGPATFYRLRTGVAEESAA